MEKINPQNWFLVITRNMSLFQACFDIAGHFLFSKKYGLIPKGHIIIVERGVRSFIFSEQEGNEKYYKSIEKVCLSKQRLEKLERIYYKFGPNLLKASRELEKTLTRQSFQNFIRAEKHLSAGLYLTTAIGRHLPELFNKQIKQIYPKISQEKIDLIISDVTYPKKFTFLTESQILLLEIGAELQKQKISVDNIKSAPKIYRKFKDYLQKYSMIPVNYNEEPWTEKQCLNQLKNLIKINCKKEKGEILKQHRERIKRAEEKLSKIKNEKIKLIVYSLQLGSFLNEYRKYIFCLASLAYRPLFQKIAKKYKLSDWREIWKLTPEEIIRLYFQGGKKLLRVLPGRNWAGLIFAKNKVGYRLLSKSEIRPFLEKIKKILPKKEKASKIQEIKGMIANPGSVSGVAKIILGSSDFHKFKDGDIIVTTMTSVDFIPLMKRASAFITNEGGITSHAGIISRELNKPCVIGTKIATQVLKDGDLVEVDASAGVVKILKSEMKSKIKK